jgi:sialate O-acetylesterase
MFGNGMVLQRERPIRIFGTAAAGSRIEGELDGRRASATAGTRDGAFAVEFPSMKAGGPYQLALKDEKGAALTFNDVYIGEVWFCGGQSNMEMPASKCDPFRTMTAEDFKTAVGKDPQLRVFKTGRCVSPGMAQGDVANGSWRAADAEALKNFSGYGYFFGRRLREKTGVPVGLIDSSWGGTALQPWTPDAAFAASGRTNDMKFIEAARDYAKAHVEGRESATVTALREWKKKYRGWDPRATQAASGWAAPELDDTGWKAGRNGEKPGVAWFRNTLAFPPEWGGKDMELRLFVTLGDDEAFFNGEKVGAKSLEKPASVSTYRVPGRLVKAGHNVLAVRIARFSPDGTAPSLWGWMPGRLGMTSLGLPKEAPNRSMDMPDTWKTKQEFAVPKEAITPEPLGIASLTGAGAATGLFNGMVAPWTALPIRGVLWHQGRSNAHNPKDYAKLLPFWLEGWRQAWRKPQMPVLFTNLAGWIHDSNQPIPDSTWRDADPGAGSAAREIDTAMIAMLRLPHVGCVAGYDLGAANNLHPTDKEKLGERAAAVALHLVYKEPGTANGPRFREARREGDTLRVAFDTFGGGLATRDGNAPGGFAVAGKNGVFRRAAATISAVDTVTLRAADVPEPILVRYAWADWPGDANLTNRGGLPAFPFKTDGNE